ncbi:MAG TPA: glycosyltransferase family 1 protein [Anaerolineae bacterium]|nr:glycosyltransferase family 1 protein [Anaerolineae bacterium]
MRVLFNGWFWRTPETGSGQYVRCLLMALAQLAPEHEWMVLLPARSAAVTREGRLWLYYVPAMDNHLGKVWWEQATVPWAARRFRADVLHVPYWAPPATVSLPTVVTIHDLIPLLLPAYRGGLGGRVYTALVRATAPRATLLLTDSEAARADIVHHLRTPAGRVRAIPLAADARYAPEALAADAEVLATRNLRPGYALYVGGFDVRKNLGATLSAFARAREVVPEARLVVAGKLPARDTRFMPDPRRLARQAGLSSEAVVFTDFVPEAELPALYRGARAFLFPSRYEGFGLPPLEALACGTPVIAAHTASLPEVVGEGGLLAAPDDVAGLAAALIRLLTDAAFYQEKRAAALTQAARFSWETTARRTLESYTAAITARG